MVTVPSFILRRLYVKGSLRNTAQGFEFQLRNSLGSGYANRLLPLIVDGVEASLERCSYTIDDQERGFDSVSRESPFTLALRRSITMALKDVYLSQGPHKIGVGFDVPGLGTLKFDFTDVPSDG